MINDAPSLPVLVVNAGVNQKFVSIWSGSHRIRKSKDIKADFYFSQQRLALKIVDLRSRSPFNLDETVHTLSTFLAEFGRQALAAVLLTPINDGGAVSFQRFSELQVRLLQNAEKGSVRTFICFDLESIKQLVQHHIEASSEAARKARGENINQALQLAQKQLLLDSG